MNDTPKDRDKIIAYLREMNAVDDMDLIIALGMAKEGFDWLSVLGRAPAIASGHTA